MNQYNFCTQFFSTLPLYIDEVVAYQSFQPELFQIYQKHYLNSKFTKKIKNLLKVIGINYSS